MAVNEAINASMKNDVLQTFGASAQPIENEHPAQREQVMEFRRGAFRVSVDMTSFYDRVKEEYGPYTAGISVSNNRRYSSLPTDPKTLIELADWLKVVADVVKGAPTRDNDRTDSNADEAKKIIAKYKRV